MQRLTVFTAITSLTLILTACSPPNPAGAEGNAIPLPGTAWAVKAIAGDNLQGDIPVTIDFSKDGRISGTSGCNRYFSNYELDGNKLTIGLIAGTKMMCSPAAMTIEQSFLSALHDTETFRTSDASGLIITGKNGDMIQATRSATEH